MNTNGSDPTCVTVRVSPGECAAIAVRGELDLAGVPIFESAVGEVELPSVRRAVLDLRQLSFIDVAGLHAVLDLHAACRHAATDLTIVPGRRNVQRVFELTGVDRHLPFAAGDRTV